MTAPSEQARSGVRAWVRQTRRNLRAATPYAIVAALAASAIAPVAAAGLGAGPEFAAALGQLGNVGGNFLADLLAGTAQRLQQPGPEPPGPEQLSPEFWRDEIAADLAARLEAGDLGLRDETAALLHAIGAVDAALQEAGDRQQELLAYAFAALGDDVGRLRVLAADAASSLAGLQAQLAGQGRTLAAQTDLLRQSLALTAQLQQEVRRRLSDAAAPPPAGPADGDSPYPGLASFAAADARHFHGRERIVADLLARLSEQLAGGPAVIVVGVSGVGKSSLLAAGVLPAVAAGGLGPDSGAWPWLLMTPGAHPLAELTGRRAALAGPADRLIIVVDQFEQLFTQCPDPAEREAFAAALATAAPALVLIAVRADFYPQCTELPALRPLLAAGQVVAGPLGVDDLRRAVREPARAAGLTLEPGLEELLLTDLGALTGDGYPPGALPLLAHALRATWERRSGATLTVAGYRAAGGIRHALAETAERVYLGLPPPGRENLRSALLALVTMAGDLPVRRKAAPGEADTGVLSPLIEARLVTAGRDGLEISHEALLTGWPRLAGWLGEAREEILLRQRLSLAAEEWSAAGDWSVAGGSAADPDALYRGARLAAARDWAAGRTDLSAAQSRFLAASEAAEQARERDRQRGVRRLRGLAAGLAVLLLLAVIGGVVALQQRADARDNARVAQAESKALRARTELFTNGPAAMRDALDAWAGAHTPESLSALLSAQQISTLGTLSTGAVGYPVVAVSPDGRRAATASYAGAIQLWDTATLRPVGPVLHQPGGQLFSLAFSPDGRYLAASGLGAAGVVVWDLPAGTLRFRLPAVGAVTWRPDSTLAASRAEHGRLLFAVGFWDPRDGHLIESVPTLTDGAQSLAISRDGRYMASAAVFGRSDIVRLADHRRLAVLPAKTGPVAFAADDSLVAVLPGDAVIGHWAVPAGRRLADLGDRDSPISATRIAVAPDGTVFVPGKGPANIVELRLTGGARLPLTDFPGVATAMDLSADGHLLLVAGINAPPMLFRTAVGRLDHPQLVGFVAADPTGARLATGSHDPVVRIWDPRVGAPVATLPLTGADGPIGLTYGPDGSLAAALGSGAVQIFDPADRPGPTLHADPGLVATDPVFSPDGALVAAAVNDSDPATQDAQAVQPGIPDLMVWDARTGAVRARIEMPGTTAIGVAFSPDGTRLYGASNRLRIINLTDTGNAQSGKVWAFRTSDWGLAASTDLDDGIGAMRLSPDGRLLAVGTGNQVRLLRAADLQPQRTIAVSAATPTGLAFAPDGRTLAVTTVAANDFTRLWDVATGELRAILSDSARDGPATYLPDGRTLAVGSPDGLVVLWQLDPADVVRRLCAVVTPQARVTGQTTPSLCR